MPRVNGFMAVVMRKYFWVINLVTISICALLAASALGKLVEARIPRPPTRRVAVPPPTLGADLGELHGRDISKILERNIFCSTCEPVTETLSAQGSAEAPDPRDASIAPVKTGLNIKLIATLVSEEDKAWSFAAIMEVTEGKTGLFAIGAKVPGEAVVTDVLERRVLLINGGRNEYLDMEIDQSDSGESSSPGTSPISPPVVSAPAPGVEDIARGIKKVADNKWEIERSALNKVLANTTLLARSARIVPSVRNGQPNGFRLYAIRPGSLYSLLGMFNGDTIHAINGHAINTPDKALEVYTKLRNATNLSISFSRRGSPLTHEYTIR